MTGGGEPAQELDKKLGSLKNGLGSNPKVFTKFKMTPHLCCHVIYFVLYLYFIFWLKILQLQGLVIFKVCFCNAASLIRYVETVHTGA